MIHKTAEGVLKEIFGLTTDVSNDPTMRRLVQAIESFAASKHGPVWVKVDKLPENFKQLHWRDIETKLPILHIVEWNKYSFGDLSECEYLSDPGTECECGKYRGVMETVLQNLSGWEDTDTMMGLAIKNITTALSPNQKIETKKEGI